MLTPTMKEFLTKVRARLEKGWTKGAFARDKTEKDVPVSYSQDACSWCMEGAIITERNKLRDYAPYCDSVLQKTLNPFLPAEYKNMRFARFNDAPETSKEDVLAVFDSAIAACNT